MRKQYKKPEILFETMKMNTSIAACLYVPVENGGGAYQDPDYVGDPGFVYMNMGEMSICTYPPMYCYQVVAPPELDSDLTFLINAS